ncbi:hypothetical protein ISU07_14905 [Nocardioides islandensis]|jgi:hypothetical protein|uniref:STAS domain-containing protein n=1 Tax=Nocardioides islandensis TaxID=433663 RepID=A0A930VGM3_9ACTN|nr:hypothetical protein [Nocardioides islandensis]MBF4764420.1 hypothetical protein [Nocardioides islandensis]
MEDCSHNFATHDERERPTRAEALVQLGAITFAGALKDLEFTLTDRRVDGMSTLAVDMTRVRDLAPATEAALRWISWCAQARGITFELQNTSPRVVERLQLAGLTSGACSRRTGPVPS